MMGHQSLEKLAGLQDLVEEQAKLEDLSVKRFLPTFDETAIEDITGVEFPSDLVH